MNPTLQTLASLRTIHGNFTEQDIPAADFDTILASAIRAANASNRQSYSIVTVEDPQTIVDLCGYRGSKALIFCVDFNRLAALARFTGHDYTPGGVVDFVTGSVDAILAAQTAVVAARSLGIDSLLTNGIHRRDLNLIYDRLNLPRKGCFPLICLVLGYPAAEPAFLKGRVQKGVIHRGKYQAPTDEDLADMLADYDNPERHLAINPNWAGHAHYMDWFFEVWTGRKNPESQRHMQAFLEEAGFID